MIDFKISRGESTTLFISPGVVNPRLIIEEGCWYLCTDTAELYLGVKSNSELTLKRINGSIVPSVTPDEGANNLKFLVEELNAKLTALESTELYQKINSEADLPTNFNDDDFNPNITYYIQVAENRIKTYVYDNDVQSYMCTNNVDELVIRAMVTEAIDVVLEDRIVAKLPEVVKQTIEGTILYGGDATPDD